MRGTALLVVAAVLLDLSGVLGEYEIKYVAVLYRHGERTPINPYPKDPNGDPSLWPVGFGELTKNGKKQHFALGKWLRTRYEGLLSIEYNPKEIFVHSTDVDRTLMSAESNLAGLFPPKPDDVFEESLPWQPIPVHSRDAENDNILGKKPCRTYDMEFANYIHSKPYTSRLAHYSGLMQYMTKQTGRAIRNYVDIEYVYSTLFIEELNNMTLPAWTQSVYPEQMRDPACYSFVLETATKSMSRLKVGPMLKQITSQMDNVTRAAPDHLRMTMYSAHDNNVGNFLNALDLFQTHCPPFAATVLVELLYNNMTSSPTEPNATLAGEYLVRIVYRNSSLGNGTVMEIPGCGTECPLAKFLQIYDHILPKDWEEECSHGLPLFVLVLMVVFAVFILINVAYHCHIYYFTNEQHFCILFIQVLTIDKAKAITPTKAKVLILTPLAIVLNDKTLSKQ